MNGSLIISLESTQYELGAKNRICVYLQPSFLPNSLVRCFPVHASPRSGDKQDYLNVDPSVFHRTIQSSRTNLVHSLYEPFAPWLVVDRYGFGNEIGDSGVLIRLFP